MMPVPGQIQKEKTPEKWDDAPFCSLSERLAKLCDQFSNNHIIDQSIFRKYIAYIKKNVHPQ